MNNNLQNKIDKILTEKYNELEKVIKVSDKRSKVLLKFLDINFNYNEMNNLIKFLKEKNYQKLLTYFDRTKYDELFQYILKNFSATEIYDMLKKSFYNHKTFKLLLRILLEKKGEEAINLSPTQKANYIGFSLIDFASTKYSTDERAILSLQTQSTTHSYQNLLQNKQIGKNEFAVELAKRLSEKDLITLIEDKLLNYLDEKSILEISTQIKHFPEEILKKNIRFNSEPIALIDLLLRSNEIKNPVKNKIKEISKIR